MRVTCLGTGAACDPFRGNTSLLLDNRLLLDCGFTVPHAYARRNPGGDELEGIWISHLHGDHCFGLPLLLLNLWERGRTRPLAVIGPQGVTMQVRDLLAMAYPGFAAKFAFALEVVEITPHTPFGLCGYRCDTAPTEHSRENLAIRIDDGRVAIYYSGDGRSTPAGVELARGCGMIFHEAFSCGAPLPGHGTVDEGLSFIEQSGASRLALLHVAPEQVAAVPRALARAVQEYPGIRASLPEDGESYEL